MKKLLFAASLIALSGCTVAQSASYATARYCYLPEVVRDANREVVAYAVAPNRIHIECAGDAD